MNKKKFKATHCAKNKNGVSNNATQTNVFISFLHWATIYAQTNTVVSRATLPRHNRLNANFIWRRR